MHEWFCLLLAVALMLLSCHLQPLRQSTLIDVCVCVCKCFHLGLIACETFLQHHKLLKVTAMYNIKVCLCVSVYPVQSVSYTSWELRSIRTHISSFFAFVLITNLSPLSYLSFSLLLTLFLPSQFSVSYYFFIPCFCYLSLLSPLPPFLSFPLPFPFYCFILPSLTTSSAFSSSPQLHRRRMTNLSSPWGARPHWVKEGRGLSLTGRWYGPRPRPSPPQKRRWGRRPRPCPQT